MPVIKNCLKCNAEMKVKPSHVDRKKFCSKDCAYAFRKENPEFYSSNLTGQHVECVNCKLKFYLSPNQIKEKNFCSKECYDSFRRGKEKKEQQDRVHLNCLFCNESFQVVSSRKNTAKFCSRTCTAKYHSRERYKDLQPNTNCSYCDKALRRKECLLKKMKHAFCNKNCMENWQKENSHLVSGENSVHWRGGKINYYGPNWLEMRRKARKRDNYTCQDCGKTEAELNQELSVHHKTPFSFFDSYKEANRLENLVSLCEYPCHRNRHSGEGHPSKFDKNKWIKI